MLGLRLAEASGVRWAFVLAVLLGASGTTTTPCFAWQSGSRGSGAGSASPSFSTPQNFSTPAVVNQGGFQSFDSAAPLGSLGSPVPFDTSGSPVTSVGPSQSVLTPAANGAPSAGGSASFGIPNASLVDPIFQINDPYSPYDVDHRAWDCFLAKYIVTDSQGLNRVRYGDVTGSDHNALKCYLRQLQSTDTRTLNRDAQLAFWFNLYNARTVDLVLDNYPIRSVRQIKEKLTDFVGPFDDAGAVTVLGKPLSLNDIESGIVRPIWNDPRIHYALNCASYGCPNLSPVAWTARNLEGNLNHAACQYINSGRAVKRGLFGVRVAKIYKWYESDFGGSDEAVLNHIARYANGRTLSKLSGRSSIVGYFYDWSLNDAKVRRPRLLEPLIR